MGLRDAPFQSTIQSRVHRSLLSLCAPSPAVLKLLLLMTMLVTVQSLEVVTTNTIEANCTSSPYSNLNLCNNSCLTCLPTNSTVCIECDDQYDYSGDGCTLKSNPYKFYSVRRLISTPFTIKDITKFAFSTADQKFGRNNTVDICMKDSFNYQMMGLFKMSDTVVHTHTFPEAVSTISVKFNYLALLANAKLRVVVVYSGKTVVQTVSSSSKTLDGIYYDSQDPDTANALSLPSLTISNPRSIIYLYEDYFAIQPYDIISIQISCTSSQNVGTVFWAFSDLTITAGECTTCIKKALQKTINTVSQLALYIFVIVAVVATLFVLYVRCISSYLREKMNRKYDDGSGKSSRIPLKVLDRLIQTLNPAKQPKEGRVDLSTRIRQASLILKSKKSSKVL